MDLGPDSSHNPFSFLTLLHSTDRHFGVAIHHKLNNLWVLKKRCNCSTPFSCAIASDFSLFQSWIPCSATVTKPSAQSFGGHAPQRIQVALLHWCKRSCAGLLGTSKGSQGLGSNTTYYINLSFMCCTPLPYFPHLTLGNSCQTNASLGRSQR